MTPLGNTDTLDAARWRKLCALVAENHMHRGLGGGVYLCAGPANEHDAAWASVQAIDHENPRNTLWLAEGATLDEAIDSVAAEQEVLDA